MSCLYCPGCDPLSHHACQCPCHVVEQLQAQVAELENHLSSMVSQRDLTIRDLKEEVSLLAGVALAANELLQVLENDKNWRTALVTENMNRLRLAQMKFRDKGPK